MSYQANKIIKSKFMTKLNLPTLNATRRAFVLDILD